MKYVIGVLDSSLFRFAFYEFYMDGGTEGEIKGEFIGRFPVLLVSKDNREIGYKIEQL